MQAHHGYEDGAGRFYITIDTDRCDGCGVCVTACPAGVLEMIAADPVEEEQVAAVAEHLRRQIRYACDPCKPRGYDRAALPCVAACAPGAISHSW